MWKHGLPILVYIGSHVISPQTLWVHNFVNMDVFSTKPVPIESPEKPLSIGTGFVENESISTKLWTNKVSVQINMEPMVITCGGMVKSSTLKTSAVVTPPP